MPHKWIEESHTPPKYERHNGRSVVVEHGYTRRHCEGCGISWVTLGMSDRVATAAGHYMGGLWSLRYECEK
jgi:hypothetical protein